MTSERFERCENCQFWSSRIGPYYCRRRAPVLVEDRNGSYTSWPNTMRNDWCGDFLERQPTSEDGV